MTLSAQELAVVQRIAKRLTSEDPVTYRAGGRAVAHQAIEHRADMVRALRGQLTELGERTIDDRRRGYQEALQDVLLAAEAALEPREDELIARRELVSTPLLQVVLDRAAIAPLTPSDAAEPLCKSAATAGRYFERLRALGLLVELPGLDGRERPHRVSTLGARLARASSAPVTRKSRSIDLYRDRVSAPMHAAAASTADRDRDPLTGTLRSEAFMRVFKSLFMMHRKAKVPMCVMRVDIAGFGELTERNDFATVDDYVVNVASTLKYEFAPPATIARYEHDKFFVLLPQMAPAEATDRANHLLPKLSPARVSIGIAGADPATRNVDVLLERSLTALKRAKQHGPGYAETWLPPRTQSTKSGR